MSEAQGEVGRRSCRTAAAATRTSTPSTQDCDAGRRLMMLGASNLWFASTQSVIVMPRDRRRRRPRRSSTELRGGTGLDMLDQYAGKLDMLRALGSTASVDSTDVFDDESRTRCCGMRSALAATPRRSGEEKLAHLGSRSTCWSPSGATCRRTRCTRHRGSPSGLMRAPTCRADPICRPEISRVVAVERLKKVNAFIGFTRIDAMDRVDDLPQPAGAADPRRPAHLGPATEDRGEGVFLQLDEDAVAAWEKQVSAPGCGPRTAGATAATSTRVLRDRRRVDPDTRLPPPRYWCVHTLSHLLIREMAMSCGYGAASLTERIYAWPADADREPAAGLLICTTASDSDGTLGGLVELSEPARLQDLVS